jgi:hypothetical protein
VTGSARKQPRDVISDTGPTAYALSVVQVLRDRLPDFDAEAAGIIARAVRRNARDPQDRFECIADDPMRANWRLRSRSTDRSRVRLACYRMPRRPADEDVERAVNAALRALEAT